VGQINESILGFYTELRANQHNPPHIWSFLILMFEI